MTDEPIPTETKRGETMTDEPTVDGRAAALDAVAEDFDAALEAMATAQETYEIAAARMRALELARERLAGPGWNASRLAGIARGLAPAVAKYGAAIAGGGGLAALAADEGAFAGLVNAIAGAFGGGG